MKVAVIGSTGYGSAELIRILEQHPHVEIGALISSSRAGEELSAAFPHLSHLAIDLEEWDAGRIAERAEAAFFAAPAGVSSRFLPELAEQGVSVVDLAGDFRLRAGEYKEWYGKEPAPEKWCNQAVYGLSEWMGDQIRQARVIANPGCYPTAALLILLPLLRTGAAVQGPLVIDAKSGMSGAGRALKPGSLFCEVNENLFPYKVGSHQHTPEIERYAGEIGGQPIPITFTPQIVPMNRGILTFVYAPAASGWTTKKLREMLADTYAGHPFVRLRSEGEWPRTKQVQGSNFCDIQAQVDSRTGMIVAAAAIDNLMKGAAGQAVQNLNLMMGWPETAGLQLHPVYP
ncbi:N-acetyl-gamma-glutamyl-phosphate reductase [Salinithrix halophila]|uniref:N-acetyl-gamma-glutamyl-phosphate reductase n=1 Tax=Salinithrix halophila TaxID=1485204 RepID=A0ABV8JES3_9BACL